MTDLIPLGDLVRDGQISYGIVQPGTDGSEGVPIVRVRDVRNGVIDTTQPLRVDAQIAAKHNKTRLRGGELLLSLVGTVGESAVVPEDLAGWNVARAIAVINPVGVSARWLQLCFESAPVRDQVQSRLNTTVQATLNLSDLKTVGIPMPTEPIRRSIEEVLGALDDKIAANTKLAETAATIAVTSLATRNTQTTQLRNLVRHKKVTIDPAAVSAVAVAHYSLPAFDVDESPEITRPDAIKSSKFSIAAPSVLISKLNPRFPRVWDVQEIPDMPAIASTEFLVLEPISTTTSVLWAILSQADFGMRLESKVAGTSGSHQRVKPADLLATEVIDSDAIPLDVQQSITSLGASIATLREENRTLAATRNALLPQLMSGKLQVKAIENTMGEMV